MGRIECRSNPAEIYLYFTMNKKQGNTYLSLLYPGFQAFAF